MLTTLLSSAILMINVVAFTARWISSTKFSLKVNKLLNRCWACRGTRYNEVSIIDNITTDLQKLLFLSQ